MDSNPISENPGAAPPRIPHKDEMFLSGAGRRMYRDMWVLGSAGVAVCWFWLGARWAAGFAAGAVLSALNFHWLCSAVSSIAEKLPGQGDGTADLRRARAPGPLGSAFRIMLRYALIGVVGYVIFMSSFVNLNAFFAGLFLFLGAVLIEAAYEIYCGLRSA